MIKMGLKGSAQIQFCYIRSRKSYDSGKMFVVDASFSESYHEDAWKNLVRTR